MPDFIIARDRTQLPVIDSAMLVISAICTVAVLSITLFYGQYGLDLTDEGFYLNWISNPFIYDWSASQFGFIYHPFYLFFDRDIASLRIFNLLLTFLLAFFLSSLTLTHSTDKPIPTTVRTIISGGVACSSLILFNLWLVTPSYNTLNFQAITLTLIGLLLASSPMPTPRHIWGYILIGIGITLTFMAKPSSALLLAIAATLYLGLRRRLTLKGALYIGVAGLLCLSFLILLIDGSPTAFVKRLQNSMLLGQALGGGHTLGQIFRLDILHIPLKELALILFLCATLSITGLVTFSRYAYVRGLAVLSALAGTSVLAIAIALPIDTLKNLHSTQTLVMTSISLSGLVLWLCWAAWNRQLGVSAQHLSLTLLFLPTPYIYVFGTNGNYWKAAAAASFFLVLAVLPLTLSISRAKDNWACLLTLVIGAQLLSTSILNTALEHPYRQTTPLRQANAQTTISHGSVLTLEKDYSTYLIEAQRQAMAAGFSQGDNAIDLSGMSPTLLYAMGARSIGQPWTIGGYPGSREFVQGSLKLVSCQQIASAWLLTEPGGPRSIPSVVLQSFGADLKRDYQLATSWTPPYDAGGSSGRTRQILYKPAHPDQVRDTCLSLRQENDT